jgi:hypothetical protein
MDSSNIDAAHFNRKPHRMESSDIKEPVAQSASNDDGLAWGAEAIGKEIDRTPGQVYSLHAAGALKGYVFKVGHRTLVGKIKKLRKFPE